MKVKLLTKTIGAPNTEWGGKSIDEIIVGAARVSSSRGDSDKFKNPEKLLRHCLLNGHWSIFEMANLGFEIETSRAIGREILRHDMSFQEYSQRYSSSIGLENIEYRKQSQDNRQSSTEVINDFWLREEVLDHLCKGKEVYKDLLEAGIARECARFVLPECGLTRIYANATIRIWLSFLNQRLHKTAQKEIRLIAEKIRDVFKIECPVISEMMFNFKNADEIHIFEQLILYKHKNANH